MTRFEVYLNRSQALEARGHESILPATNAGRMQGDNDKSANYLGSEATTEEERVARADDRGGIAGISVGGIIVIVGIVLMFIWSFWIGLIIALVGLIAFGGFARGKWY